MPHPHEDSFVDNQQICTLVGGLIIVFWLVYEFFKIGLLQQRDLPNHSQSCEDLHCEKCNFIVENREVSKSTKFKYLMSHTQTREHSSSFGPWFVTYTLNRRLVAQNWVRWTPMDRGADSYISIHLTTSQVTCQKNIANSVRWGSVSGIVRLQIFIIRVLNIFCTKDKCTLRFSKPWFWRHMTLRSLDLQT